MKEKALLRLHLLLLHPLLLLRQKKTCGESKRERWCPSSSHETQHSPSFWTLTMLAELARLRTSSLLREMERQGELQAGNAGRCTSDAPRW